MTSIRAVIVLAIAVVCESVSAADTARTQVMPVGTYHFSNPGKDIHNVKAIDVLTAERQRELGKVIAALAKFAPTRGRVLRAGPHLSAAAMSARATAGAARRSAELSRGYVET
jgi:hypothetical protein